VAIIRKKDDNCVDSTSNGEVRLRKHAFEYVLAVEPGKQLDVYHIMAVKSHKIALSETFLVAGLYDCSMSKRINSHSMYNLLRATDLLKEKIKLSPSFLFWEVAPGCTNQLCTLVR
jgi:hypothetical protein